MRQVLGAGALGRPRGMGWGGRWEGCSGWGIHVTPWLIHVSVSQKPLQYCKVISLQLIKINGKKKWKKKASNNLLNYIVTDEPQKLIAQVTLNLSRPLFLILLNGNDNRTGF